MVLFKLISYVFVMSAVRSYPLVCINMRWNPSLDLPQ